MTPLSESAKRQMLLDLLRMRYGEAPIFIEVTSVVGAYAREHSIRGIGEHAIPGIYRSGDNIARLDALSSFTDRPTITYQPLVGEKFAKTLMAPIPPSSILLLIQTGYSAEVVLRVCVNTINGLENACGGRGNPHPGDPRFSELPIALGQSRAAVGLDFRTRAHRGGQEVEMLFRPFILAAAGSNRRVRQLLGLHPTRRVFKVIPGIFADNATEIAI